MYYIRFFLLLAVGCVVTACGLTQESASSGSESDSDRIVVSKLSGSVVGLSAYDLVEEHRAFWLRKRGEKSIRNPDPIRVYLDGGGSPLGDVSALRSIRAENIEFIDYFDPNRAQMRFGMDNSSGAIMVHTKQGPGSS